jgi:hypothetical protein
MPSPAESEPREVLYCGQSTSIPGTLLYTSGELAYVRFRTRHWAGYGGFQNYVVTAIFREHLRPVEERPDVPYVTSGTRSQGAAAIGQAEAEVNRPILTESTPQAPPAAAAKPVQPEPSKGKLNGKEFYAGVRFPTRSPIPVRTIGGLSLKDFLGNR